MKELVDISISFFTFHILYLSFRYTNSNNCNTTFSIWIQSHLAIIAFIRLKIHICKSQIVIKNFFKKHFWINPIFEIISILSLTLWAAAGLYFIHNDINNDDCCFNEFILFFILFVLVFALFFYFVTIYSWVWRFKKHKNDYKKLFVKESLIKLYENTKKNSYILNYFIKNNESVLLKVGILNIEKKILLNKSNFIKNTYSYNECVICQDFLVNKSNKIIEIGCRHNFHFGCIVPWLKKKPTCPLCKTHFRLNLRI